MTGFMYLLRMRSVSSNGEYFVDENSDGITDYSFAKPDFNFVQFRSNLVVAGNTNPVLNYILLVAEEIHQMHLVILDTPLGQSLFDNAFAEQARNIFLIKWTYRFLR